MRHDGRANLIDGSMRSQEELKAQGRKGGIASGKTRRMQKTFKDMAKMILGLPISAKERKALIKTGLDAADIPTTKKGLMLFSVAQKAITKGDSQAMMRLAELTGEHIDEKKISVGGDVGQRSIINIKPKGAVDVEVSVIKPVYIKGSVYATDEE